MIADFTLVIDRVSEEEGVAMDNVVLALGNGDILLLSLKTDLQTDLTVATVVAKENICDIKLLSCFAIPLDDHSFDILGANGRSELVKATFDRSSGSLGNRQVFKADQKV